MTIYAEDVIKVVSNFMDETEMKFWRDFNDEILETHKPHLAIFEDGTRPLLEFGIDRSDEHANVSHHTFDIISDVEHRVRNVMDRVVSQAQESFRDSRELYVCSFWFAKQLPGAFVAEHEDTDDGYNTHFEYSAVLYLNTLKRGGTLYFTEMDYDHTPVAGDLVLFKTQTVGRHKVNKISEDRYTIPMWITDNPKFAL